MEATDNGWFHEMKKYFLSIENLTESALKRIRRDRIQKNLPFDDAFKKYFLDWTNSRIANVTTNFFYENHLEDGQILSNQIFNHRCDGNSHTNIGQELTMATISPQSIEQMPIILVQSNNQNLASNTNTSTAFVQNGHQMSDQIIISMPSNPISVPSESDINQNPEQESSIQRTESIGLKEEPSGEDKVTNESIVESDSNENNEMDMEWLSSSANGPKYEERMEQIVNTIEQQPDSIDLTSDQEDVVDTVDCEQNDGDQTKPNVKRQKVYGARSAGIFKEQESFNSTIIKSRNVGELVANDDHIELTSENTDTDILHVNTEMELVVLSAKNIELNSQKTSSDRIGVPTDEQWRNDGETPVTGEKMSSNQFPQTIDLISDQDDTVNLDGIGNGGAKNVENVPGQWQPTIQRRRIRNDNGSGHMKKKPKLTDKVDTMKRHKCDYCEFSTAFKSTLTVHLRTHTNERPYECKVCEKQFAQKSSLNRHMKTHRDLFAFHCSKCHQRFAHQELCKLHESRCKAKGYECHLCKTALIHKQHLVQHMRKHTGEKLRCSKCRNQFSYKSGLALHMKTHGKLFRFQCSHCRQGFSHQSERKLHENRCKSKQYECHLCSKKCYQQKHNLLVHMRRKHTGEMPFSCADCRKRFCKQSVLIRHVKCCHKKI